MLIFTNLTPHRRSEMLKSLADFFNYFVETLDCWKLAVDKTPALLKPYCNQCDQLRLCERVQLDEKFLKKFPSVKEKLSGKIRIGIEEEMRLISKIEEEMKLRVDGLKTRLSSIERAYSKYIPEETAEFNPLIPSYESLMEHALDVWRCFHILWIGVKNSIETVDHLSKSSVNNISKSLLKYETMKPHFEYILDLTQFLRT